MIPICWGETRCLETQAEIQTQRQRDTVSTVESGSGHLGQGDRERRGELEPRAGSCPGRIWGGGEPLKGVHPVICKTLFPLLFLISDLGITLRVLGSRAERVMVGSGFSGFMASPAWPCPGISFHRVASWVHGPETQSVRL